MSVVSVTSTVITEFTIQTAQTTTRKADSKSLKMGDKSSLILGVGLLVVAGGGMDTLICTENSKRN